jgi:hypothetical protein
MSIRWWHPGMVWVIAKALLRAWGLLPMLCASCGGAGRLVKSQMFRRRTLSRVPRHGTRETQGPMRESLKKSIADSPVQGFERYPKGSVVLCNACAAPIYKLEGGIALGDKGGRMASRFKPVTLADLAELEGRVDIDAGIRARLSSMSVDQRRAHIATLTEPKAGDAMACPACGGCFAQVLSTEVDETHDRAYVLELLTIPPFGAGRPAAIRGKRFNGERGDWLH